MHISARVDCAVRALVDLAAADAPALVKADALSASQSVAPKFLEAVLAACAAADWSTVGAAPTAATGSPDRPPTSRSPT